MFYVETGSIDPYYNLALEEFILLNRKDGDYCMLWQNDNTIVIGQNQNPQEEINLVKAKEQKVNIVRRATGGGTVYHDYGNINFSFVTDVGDVMSLTMKPFAVPVVRALKKLGLDAALSGKNDILAEGKKISGTAQRIAEGRLLFHGTLLFDSDLRVLSELLIVDPLKYKSRATQSVRSRVENIREILRKTTGREMDTKEFMLYLKENLFEAGMKQVTLSEDEIEEILKIREEKYLSWEWNYGKSPTFGVVKKKRFNGGTVGVRMETKNGIIKQIGFQGDFLSLKDLQELEERLEGCRLREEDLKSVLDSVELSEYFGSINGKEILCLILEG